MKAMRIVAAAMTTALATAAPAQDRTGLPRTDAPALQPYKIVLVGDSTMAPHSGWASAFCANHVKSSVACLNLGRGGRSTRSYRAEGSWAIALDEARVRGYRATYVLIQFGHNDQSSRPERWTEIATEFPANLRRFVAELREAGAIPVLLTPLTRRAFRQGRLDNDLAPWAAQIRSVAAALDVPLVDLNAESAEAVQRMGAETAAQLAQLPPSPEELEAARRGSTLPARPAPTEAESESGDAPAPGPRGRVTRKFDHTHVGPVGAQFFARMVARSLARAAPALAAQLLP